MDLPLPGDALSGGRALLFGKLPAHGDFVARGCDPARQEGYDRWLSGALMAAREACGAEFEARYDAAPAWRFGFPEGDGWLGGAMAPSMDAAGRRFPILVGCYAPDEAAALRLAQACEDAIYQAFARRLTADELHAGLETLAADAAAPPRLPGWWTAGNEAFPPTRLDGARPEGVIAAMLGAASATETA